MGLILRNSTMILCFRFFYLQGLMRSMLLALGFVLPLYWVWFFEFFFQRDLPLILNSIFALLSLYIFFSIPSSSRFQFGFFVGIFWFYWIGFSFQYFGFAFMIPIISIFVACIYMLIFACALWFDHLIYRGIWLLFMSAIHPFSFDWFNIDSFFAYSYFGVSKEDFYLLILSVILFKLASKVRKRFSILGCLFLCFALDFKHSLTKFPFKVALIETSFSQDLKWSKNNARQNAETQIQSIIQSIQNQNQLIVLPETAFPFILEQTHYFPLLQNLSHQATLVVGSMRQNKQGLYNSTYVFQKGKVQVFDKVILAPFGEKIPLPEFLEKPLRDVFWGKNSPALQASSTFGTFTLKGQQIKSAICYEGTSEQTYQDFPKYLIVISNNAWFHHTIEPALQKNLMKYYARLYHTTILHSSNGSPSFVIFP